MDPHGIIEQMLQFIDRLGVRSREIVLVLDIPILADPYAIPIRDQAESRRQLADSAERCPVALWKAGEQTIGQAGIVRLARDARSFQ